MKCFLKVLYMSKGCGNLRKDCNLTVIPHLIFPFSRLDSDRLF